jgi:hypothetical protein
VHGQSNRLWALRRLPGVDGDSIGVKRSAVKAEKAIAERFGALGASVVVN